MYAVTRELTAGMMGTLAHVHIFVKSTAIVLVCGRDFLCTVTCQLCVCRRKETGVEDTWGRSGRLVCPLYPRVQPSERRLAFQVSSVLGVVSAQKPFQPASSGSSGGHSP